MTTGGIVLCGGLSSRMGRPKAFLPWRGKTLVEHVVGTLRQVVEEVIVVASAELDLPSLEAQVVRDREPRLGPLGGIREGLEAITADLAFVTSTDAPFLTPAFVRTLLSFGTAAAPEVDGFVQSLSAVYPRSLASKANELIAAGRMRPLFLLEAGNYRKVLPHELPDVESIRNLNTPETYLEALGRESAPGTVTVELFGLSRVKAGIATLEARPGHLREVLQEVPNVVVCPNGGIAEPYLVSLNGKMFVRDPQVPVGPGDRVIVMDAAVGG